LLPKRALSVTSRSTLAAKPTAATMPATIAPSAAQVPSADVV